MMSNLLLDERPIMVLPKLACEIGLNEAIILQQIHYWLQKSKNIEAGHKWIYNTYNAWQKQFPFWSIPTIRRTITSLEKQGVIVTGNFNKAGFDKTKWYRIDYQKLESMSRRCDQNDQTMRSIWTDGADQNDQTNTIDYTETTTETTTNNTKGQAQPDHAPYQEILDYLNSKVGTSYRASSKATQRLIKARSNEGFEVEDFKKVIDIKVAAWKNDPKMSQYLRPATLFGTKFESYLNEPMPTRQPANPYDRYYE